MIGELIVFNIGVTSLVGFWWMLKKQAAYNRLTRLRKHRIDEMRRAARAEHFHTQELLARACRHLEMAPPPSPRSVLGSVEIGRTKSIRL